MNDGKMLESPNFRKMSFQEEQRYPGLKKSLVLAAIIEAEM